MYAIILFAILTGATCVLAARLRIKNEGDKRFYSRTGSVFGPIFGACFGVIFASFLGSVYIPQRWEQIDSVELHSVTNVQGVQASGGGNIFMWNFQIGYTTYYNYWYKDGNGYRHAQMTDADNVKVIEDANPDTATMGTYGWVCDPNVLKDIAFCTPKIGKEHDFHVPPGTVVHQFTLTPGGQPSK